MACFLAVLAWMVAAGVTVVAPVYPAGVVSGGTVVAVMHVAGGRVKGVDVSTGEAPFLEPVRSALLGWHFPDSESGDILVVVNFRTPNLYATGSAARNVKSAKPAAGLAYPETVIEPVYPANSLGEGSVVLKVTIGSGGSVSKISVIQGLGDLTDPCLEAVRKWKFTPALTPRGSGQVSEAYAVCVIRRPNLGQKK